MKNLLPHGIILMTIRIGNAPCSWGVEFADDTRNPHWSRVLDECARAGFKGITPFSIFMEVTLWAQDRE